MSNLATSILASTSYDNNIQMDAFDYINYVYGENNGWICRGQKTKGDGEKGDYRQRHYKRDEILKQNFSGEKNVYLSVNNFMRPKRTKENLKHLNGLYVDLDLYKLGFTKEQVLFQLNENEFGNTIPYPTFVIDSGRGLYCLWCIDEDRNALPRWKRVMDYLHHKLIDYGADSACNDVARILRIPTTINSKSDTPVNVISFFPHKYTLHEIISEYKIPYPKYEKKQKDANAVIYPYGQATERQRQYARMLAVQNNVELPNFADYDNTQSFISSLRAPIVARKGIVNFATINTKPVISGRMRDLEHLYAHLRTGEDCKRENGLFVYRLLAIQALGDYGAALDATLELNSRMDCPLPTQYVIEKTYSAEKRLKSGKNYIYSRPALYRLLDIQPHEASQLPYLADYNASDAKQKKQARNHRAYLSRLETCGKTTKREEIAERQRNIRLLLAEGKTKEDICHTLNISSATYQRDKAVIGAVALVKSVKQTLVSQTLVSVANTKAYTQKTEHNSTKKRETLTEWFPLSKIKPTIYRGASEACPASDFYFSGGLFCGSDGQFCFFGEATGRIIPLSDFVVTDVDGSGSA